ncbi:hypothetical protein GCM10010331_36340 [Streptomyces xanthochromogenes]|nr:hypothetical protein GCM10010331_36340 [Streptomyces xanthochromogenes]
MSPTSLSPARGPQEAEGAGRGRRERFPAAPQAGRGQRAEGRGGRGEGRGQGLCERECMRWGEHATVGRERSREMGGALGTGVVGRWWDARHPRMHVCASWWNAEQSLTRRWIALGLPFLSVR